MDPLHPILNDHANIVSLCSDVLRSMPGGDARSRERLFSQLNDGLRWHMEAEEDSLYDALEDHDRTKQLIDELEDEHEQLKQELGVLARAQHKGSEEWTQQFEDFSYLLDRHFHREEHELFPVAREVLDPEQVRELLHEFAEEKAEEIRETRQGAWGDIPTGLLVGALVGAAAGAVVFTAWRRGSLGSLVVRPPVRRYLSKLPGVSRITDRFRRSGRTLRRPEADVLRDIARRTRCPVQDVSSRLQLPIGRTYAIVAALERQGLVRSAYEQGAGRVRTVAITTRGRETAQG